MNPTEAVGAWVRVASFPELLCLEALLFSRKAELLAAAGGLGPQASAGEPKWVSARTAAAQLGVSPSYFYHHPETPGIRKIGRTVRVDVAAVVRAIEAEQARN